MAPPFPQGECIVCEPRPIPQGIVGLAIPVCLRHLNDEGLDLDQHLEGLMDKAKMTKEEMRALQGASRPIGQRTRNPETHGDVTPVDEQPVHKVSNRAESKEAGKKPSRFGRKAKEE